MDFPKKYDGNVTGVHLLFPDQTGKRQAEGGYRLKRQVTKGDTKLPLVSILTVCWNSEKTLEQTIKSVQAQTYGNIEHIVVDGASSDGTIDILRRYEDCIAYYVSEPDNGLYYAMNKALKLAQGDYILILNSDDWYVSDCVSALVSAQKETKADFVSGLANYVDGDGAYIRTQPSFSFDGNAYFMMPLRHETMLLSRDIYERVGPFDTDFRVIADRVFTTRLYAMGHTHYEIQRPLMNFRDTGVSSVNLDGLRTERKKIIQRNFPFLSEDDRDALAFLEELSASRLEEMVKTYAHPKLSRAAADLVADRQSRKSPKWMGLDAAALKRVGQEQSLPYRAPRAERMLRVATLVTSDHGGAGIGSQRRIEALRKAGVDARLYCLFRNTSYPHVSELEHEVSGRPDMTRRDVHQEWRRQAVVTKEDVPGLRAREFFSKTGAIVDLEKNREIFDEADIIHLHWPVGVLNFDQMGRVFGDKPVVWTPADMNPFTGGCHYSEGCQAYMKSCERCTLLSGSGLAHESWKVKKAAYGQIENLQVVSPSIWLAERARKSSLLGDRPIHVIPNAFPVERFSPSNKLVARRKLGLPLDKKLILFGADNVTNLRKGGDLMQASIARLVATGRADGVEGVFFGSNGLQLSIPTHAMGHITDLEKLSLVYAAADVFASPSREDSGPMTVAEAMLSGTPVVAFDVGNAPEIIVHLESGYIAGNENVADFTAGLVWALKEGKPQDRLRRSLQCHFAAKAHNDPGAAAARHIALYESLLKSEIAEREKAVAASA